MAKVTASGQVTQRLSVQGLSPAVSQKSCGGARAGEGCYKKALREQRKAFQSFPLKLFLNINKNKYPNKVFPMKYIKLKT